MTMAVKIHYLHTPERYYGPGGRSGRRSLVPAGKKRDHGRQLPRSDSSSLLSRRIPDSIPRCIGCHIHSCECYRVCIRCCSGPRRLVVITVFAAANTERQTLRSGYSRGAVHTHTSMLLIASQPYLAGSAEGVAWSRGKGTITAAFPLQIPLYSLHSRQSIP
jgi:hypothetical protein